MTKDTFGSLCMCVVAIAAALLAVGCATADATDNPPPENPCSETGKPDLERCVFPEDNVILYVSRRAIGVVQNCNAVNE